jgi:hypothetical protein
VIDGDVREVAPEVSHARHQPLRGERVRTCQGHALDTVAAADDLDCLGGATERLGEHGIECLGVGGERQACLAAREQRHAELLLRPLI